MHPLFRVLLAGAGLYVLACAAIALCAESLFFWPDRGGPVLAPGAEVWLRADDGVKLHAWHVQHDPTAPTLLYLHGAGGSLASRSDRLALFSRLGANLFALEYRGYGQSEGKPSEQGMQRDARAAYEWLAHRTPRIVPFGESLGGVLACELAATHPVAGLIILSSSTSARELAARLLPVFPMRQLLRTHADCLASIPNVSAPKLFIHGRHDEVVPFTMAEQLFANAREPKQHLWLAHAKHDDTFYVERNLTTRTMAAFLARVR